MAEIIILDFDEDDNPQLTVQGVKGSRCKQVSVGIAKALGGVTLSDKPTDEMTQKEVSGEHRKLVTNR